MLLRIARLFQIPSPAHRLGRVQRRLRFESLEARRVLSASWIEPVAEGEEATPGPVVTGNPRPDFELPDVNPNSLTSGTAVSPRDYLSHVSVWYFTFFT